MKKTITLPNGQTEVVEGTAQEIADYERAKRDEANEGKKSKKKILLTEEDVRKVVREEILAHELTKPATITIPYISPIECQHEYPNPWMAVIPPSCIKCGKRADWSMPYTTIWTGSGVPDCVPMLDMDGKTIPCATKVDGCFQSFEPTELEKTLQVMVGKINSNYSSQA